MLEASGGRVALLQEPELVYLPLWREAFMGVEYLKLKVSPLYYGVGVPKGDGAPVVLVPGFLGCDAYLLEMYLWLRRIGHRPYMSRIGYNAECPDLLTRRLLRTVNKAYGRSGRKVHIVGHSLGGILARGAAFFEPDKVASVVMLASPFRGVRINPIIGQTLEYVRKKIQKGNEEFCADCFSMVTTCEFPRAMQGDFPANIPQTAVYTKDDGVVDWKTCINNNPRTDVEVSGTHTGLTWNAQAYRAVAEHLASAARFAKAPPFKRKAHKVPTKKPRAKKKTVTTLKKKAETKPTAKRSAA